MKVETILSLSYIFQQGPYQAQDFCWWWNLFKCNTNLVQNLRWLRRNFSYKHYLETLRLNMDEFPANGVIIIVLLFLLLTLNKVNTFFWCFIANFDRVLRIGLKLFWHLYFIGTSAVYLPNKWYFATSLLKVFAIDYYRQQYSSLDSQKQKKPSREIKYFE